MVYVWRVASDDPLLADVHVYQDKMCLLGYEVELFLFLKEKSLQRI